MTKYQCTGCGAKFGSETVARGHMTSCPEADDANPTEIKTDSANKHSKQSTTTMSQNNSTTESKAPAQQIEDFETLKSRQVAFNEYRVLNLKDDGKSTAYTVDLSRMTCGCKDETYNVDKGQGEVCKHLAYALYQAPKRRQAEEHTLRQLASITTELQAAIRETRPVGGVTQTQEQTDETEDEEPEGDVVEKEPDDYQQELIGELESWFVEASNFNDFDPAIIELSWAEFEGSEGIAVETVPWNGDYYDDGEWQDQEGFDAENDKLREGVLSPRDEFNWYGEPDYQYVIAEDDIMDVASR